MNPRECVETSMRLFEGGDSNHPDDRGGFTRYGLTWKTFTKLRPGATEADFRALTNDDVLELLTEEFALKPGFARIHDARVRWAVIDYAIHSGPPRATKALQRAIGAHVDGIFGPDTEHICNLSNGVRVFELLIAARLRQWAETFRTDKTQRAFAAGWLNRAATILETA